MSEPVTPLDRRQRRRLETIEEVLDIAVEIMAEQGVAGLSIGEVARRMGIRPPSLYVYFPSKHALYDALFARGAESILEAMSDRIHENIADATSLEAALSRTADVFVRWSIAHPTYTQLLFWRPVPGFTPSEQAYAPAVELLERTRAGLESLQRRGLLRADVDVADVQRDWTILTSGVVSQQLSNAPDESFETGRFTAALPGLVAMFARYYAAPSSKPTRRGHRADQG
jgi:AcrR family transcriptional regulator